MHSGVRNCGSSSSKRTAGTYHHLSKTIETLGELVFSESGAECSQCRRPDKSNTSAHDIPEMSPHLEPRESDYKIGMLRQSGFDAWLALQVSGPKRSAGGEPPWAAAAAAFHPDSTTLEKPSCPDQLRLRGIANMSSRARWQYLAHYTRWSVARRRLLNV